MNKNYSEIDIAKTLVYDACEFDCTDSTPEAESAEYGALTLKINGISVRYRDAKITPTKTGLFVTLWKRVNHGPIEPFNLSDDTDLIIVSTRNGSHFGQFIFPKYLLHEKGIIAGNGKAGKRAFRVYPPWSITNNLQAKKTQQWQVAYFINISDQPDLKKAKKLFNIK